MKKDASDLKGLLRDRAKRGKRFPRSGKVDENESERGSRRGGSKKKDYVDKKDRKPVSVYSRPKHWIVNHYSLYLKSKHWATIRRAWISSGRPYECYICGRQEYLQFHHRSYHHLGQERLDDLMVLCETCHTYLHYRLRTKKSKKTNLYNIADRLIKELEQEERSNETGERVLIPLI